MDLSAQDHQACQDMQRANDVTTLQLVLHEVYVLYPPGRAAPNGPNSLPLPPSLCPQYHTVVNILSGSFQNPPPCPDSGVPVFPHPQPCSQAVQLSAPMNGQVDKPFQPVAPPPEKENSKKGKPCHNQCCQSWQEDDQPYVKKPLNAFMIYRKEQRPKVMDEFKTKDNAIVNQVLGYRWKMLPKEEQTKYYKEAQKEKLLHAHQHPNWSSKINYGLYKYNKKMPNSNVTSTSVSKAAYEDVPGPSAATRD